MRMITHLLVLALLASWLTGPAAAAVEPAHSLLRSELISERTTVTPGSTVMVALRQHLAPGWHTYWRNPGSIGQATRLSWSLPAGWHAGDLQWPTPHVFRFAGITNFVYSKEVVLPLKITVPAAAPMGSVRLQAVVTALLCRDVCIPTRETLYVPLTVGAAAGAPTPDAPAIQQAAISIARRATAVGILRASGDGKMTVAVPGVTGGASSRFFPFEGQSIDGDAPMAMRLTKGGAILSARAKVGSALASHITGLISPGDGSPDVVITATAGTLPRWASVNGQRSGAFDLIIALLLAFGGGLILNAMPCVFPILAGKLATLASTLGVPRAMRREAVAYSLGSVTAFVALAAILIAFRAMGQAIGWGFQLQSPMVVALLALVMLASALNLAGLFEAGLFLQRVAGTVRVGSGDIGAFITGALAASVAAPCTAPLMAPAIGWAVTQPAPLALLVFAALGLGLGSPFLAISLLPGLHRHFPRPGPWLGHLRQLLAFPMLAGASWLTWIFVVQRGPDGLPGLLVALLGLAFALWCWGIAQRSTRGTRWRIAAFLAASTLVPGGVLPSLSGSVAARDGASDATAERWSAAKVLRLRQEGHPVLVDVSAAWCITCKVNEAVALNTPAVRQTLQKTEARILKADWTRPNAEIERLLSAHGRSGVPFYLVYAPDGREIQMPQVLTPQIISAALESASDRRN